MMSSMPWVSTFCPDWPPGDGGGECGTRPALLLGRSSKRSVGNRGGDPGVEPEEPECERFCFFATCWRSAVVGGERADRGAPGSCMPSDGSDSDFRRVLYVETMAMCVGRCVEIPRSAMRRARKSGSGGVAGARDSVVPREDWSRNGDGLSLLRHRRMQGVQHFCLRAQ